MSESDKRFIMLMERIDEIKKCVNKMQIRLETHIQTHDKISESKNLESRSNREKIAIIVSIITTTVAILSIIPSLFS